MSPRTAEQARANLAVANARIAARKADKDRIAALPEAEGFRALADLILDMPAHIASAQPRLVLLWVRRVGPQYADMVLRSAGLDLTTRRLGQLTERELGVFVSILQRLAT